MASIAFPSLSKRALLSDGTTYGYVHVPPSSAPGGANRATLLLLHGYPSSSFDWRLQIEALSAAGFGVLAPDLLGYGDTDAPPEVDAYRMALMAGHVAEIMDEERVERCVAVGHDWGSVLVSRLVTYFPHRLLGAVFLSVGFMEPGFEWDIPELLRTTREAYGYETLGYWPWHGSEEAIDDCEKHPASVFSLIYPPDPLNWKKNVTPVDKAAEYVRAGRTDPLPSWYTQRDYETRERIFAIKGYRGPLNWYKAAIRGVNLADEAALEPHQRACGVPTLLIVSDQDYVTRADENSERTKKWAKNLRIKTLHCGHWIQLDKPDELQPLLENFAVEVNVADS